MPAIIIATRGLGGRYHPQPLNLPLVCLEFLNMKYSMDPYGVI